MNSKERFLNMVQGKEVDRRLFGAVLSLYGAKLTGCTLEKYYNDAAEYARGQDAIRHAIDPDFLITPFILAGYGEAFGSRLKYFDNNAPNLVRTAIGSAGDLPRLTVPCIDTHPRLLYIRDALRRMVTAHGRDKNILAIVLSPMDLPIVIMGLDEWMKTVLADEDGTRRMLDIMTPFFVDFCNALFRDGADAIVMPISFLTRAVTTRRIAVDIALPCLRQAFEKVEGPLVLHHTGSSFLDYLDLMAVLPNVAGFALDHRDNPARARESASKEQILIGGLDSPTLYAKSPAWIKTRSLTVLEERREDHRFVLFASSTDVILETPLENLLAIREAVEEFGGW